MSDPLVGIQLGEYIIGPRIAEGAIGAIYRIFKSADNNGSVVKVMLAQYDNDHEVRKGFKRKGALLQSLCHPYIIPILAYGEHDLTGVF